jgi:tetratricopeptide (TPR) repeat protein
VKRYQQAWGNSCNNFGILCRRAGHTEQAKKAHETARQAFQQLIDGDPQVPDYQYELALGYTNLGHVAAVSKELNEAKQAYRESITLFERLTATPSPLPAYLTGLAGSYGSLADVLTQEGDLRAALAWYDKAIRQLQNLPADPRPALAERFLRDAQLKRAKTLARLGDHVRASAEVQALINAPATDGETLYESVCVYSLALGKLPTTETKQAEEYANRAVELLNRAQTAGYFNDPEALAEMDKDEDLQALRQRPEFQKWRAQRGRTGTGRTGPARLLSVGFG